MKKKTWMKYIAGCLTLALFVTMVPMQAAANTEKQGGTGTPGAVSGGAASVATPTPTATATASATPTATATVNPTLYELDAADGDGKRWFKPSYAFVEQGDRSEWLLYLFS